MKTIKDFWITVGLIGVLAGCTENTGEQAKGSSDRLTAPRDASSIVPANAEVKKLSEDQFEFVEGPAWDGQDSVYFTDIPNNSIYRYSVSSGTFELVTSATAGANGLMFNRDENLLACEQDSGAITEWDTEGNRLRTLVSQYDGTRFNRPNDLVIDRSNGIYFTDPSWSDDRPQQIKGVYYADAQGNVRLLVDDMDKPNGIILSRDESILYIVDSDSFEVRAYPVTAPGQLGNRSTFTVLVRPQGYQGNTSSADGIALDRSGNLYITTKFGVQIFGPQGDLIDMIELPESPSNCEFVGSDLDTLFITAGTNVYSIKLNTRGVIFPLPQGQ